MPSLSIIIPTHKRAKILQKCLEHIDKQTICGALDVIVVSDGPDEETARVCEMSDWKTTVRFFEIEKAQQGVARNRGVMEARAPRTLFIGDDIFLAPDACQQHITTHLNEAEEDRPLAIAVLGYTTWDPELKITPTMKWLERSGWQFGYPLIESYAQNFIPSPIQHRFTYTSHLSLPTDIAKEHPFHEDATLYGWEDIEWGMRLKELPLKLFYEPHARAFHHHSMSMEDSLERMETLGRSVTHFSNLDRKPKGLKRIAYTLTSFLPTKAGKHRKAFLKGIKSKSNNC